MNSLNIGKIFGVQVRIHWSFWILPLWIYFSSILGGAGLTYAVATVLFVFAIFGCVLLHELGHAMAARQFGIPTRDITLLPIGGLAALERMPRNPFQELWIAIAGPLVNVAIATMLLIGLVVADVTSATMFGSFMWRLALANVVLVVFNMIPAFPMDGGRVLRSVFAMFMEWSQATRIAATVGKVSAVGLGLLGILSGNLVLVLVAMFVFFAAQSELNFVNAQSRPFPGGAYSPMVDRSDAAFQPFDRDGWEPPRNATPSADTVPASLSTLSVIAWLNNKRLDSCQVVESGRVLGTITRSQLVNLLSRGFGNFPVGSFVR